MAGTSHVYGKTQQQPAEPLERVTTQVVVVVVVVVVQPDCLPTLVRMSQA